jgi:hypothetical protein
LIVGDEIRLVEGQVGIGLQLKSKIEALARAIEVIAAVVVATSYGDFSAASMIRIARPGMYGRIYALSTVVPIR